MPPFMKPTSKTLPVPLAMPFNGRTLAVPVASEPGVDATVVADPLFSFHVDDAPVDHASQRIDGIVGRRSAISLASPGKHAELIG